MVILCTIVSELQGINSNTAATAKGISSIEIVSANTPVNDTRQMKQQKNKPNHSSSNSGYNLARQIASYK